MGYNSNHSTSKATREKQKAERLGMEKLNNQGCLMKIVEYEKTESIVVEFQDDYKYKIVTRYKDFIKGSVRNPYLPNIYGGVIGVKYPAKVNNKITKEYFTWKNMLVDCADDRRNMICCDEWLLFENFYEWIHSQKNFQRFLDGKKWSLSKDIIKGNKLYSPETCYLVPQNISKLFVEQNINTDVSKEIIKKYKEYRESTIKKVAETEYSKGNITKECYNAMMEYEVEITD